VAFALAAVAAEEPGWRGVALPWLRRRSGPLLASVVLAVVWAVWHLPLYAVTGSYQHDEVGFGSSLFWAYSAGFLPQTVLITRLVEASRGSVATAMVFHAAVNVSGEVVALTGPAQWLRVGLWGIAAAPVVVGWLRDR
jgi:membrane protease YdiL (CAAX protease family)